MHEEPYLWNECSKKFESNFKIFFRPNKILKLFWTHRVQMYNRPTLTLEGRHTHASVRPPGTPCEGFPIQTFKKNRHFWHFRWKNQCNGPSNFQGGSGTQTLTLYKHFKKSQILALYVCRGCATPHVSKKSLKWQGKSYLRDKNKKHCPRNHNS